MKIELGSTSGPSPSYYLSTIMDAAGSAAPQDFNMISNKISFTNLSQIKDILIHGQPKLTKEKIDESLFDNFIKWFSVKQAARYLSRSPNAIRIAVHRNKLRAYKNSRRLYFKRADLDKLLTTSLLSLGGHDVY